MLDEIRPLLKDCGLTHRECETYLALLQLGKATVQELADTSHVPRTATYPALESLVDKGLATEHKEPGKTLYQARSPDRLREMIAQQTDIMNQRLAQLDTSMEVLRALFSDGNGKPRVRYVEGMEGILVIREEIAMSQEPVDEWFVHDEFIDAIFDAAILQRDHQMRIQHGRTIVLLPEGRTLPSINHDHFQVRVQKVQKAPFSGGLAITGTKAYLFTHGKAPTVLVLESPFYIDMMKTLFEQLWEVRD